MKLLALLLSLIVLLCGCRPDKQESVKISDFVYYCSTDGNSAYNDNIFLHPYKDGFVCLNYVFYSGNYKKIKGMLLTSDEQEQLLKQLEAGVTPTERYDSDERGGHFREYAICTGDKELSIEALDLSFLEFEELSEKYSYDDMESSYERAQKIFSLSEETMEELGWCGSESVLPAEVIIVYMANQIAEFSGERIRSVEEISADTEHFSMEITLRNDQILVATATYTGLIVEWESN